MCANILCLHKGKKMSIVTVRPFPFNVSIKYTLECQTEEGNGGVGGLYQKILQNVTNKGLENS